MTLRALSFGSGWGQHAARVFAADPRTHLGGLVGRGSARSKALANELGVPIFGDAAEAISVVRPEIASVSVHERENVALVESLLSTGCHVLCSHPVAPSSAQVRALLDRAKNAGVVAATDYTLRLQPAFIAITEARKSTGALLRLSMESPGSTSVMAVDLALALAGPVEVVRSSKRYPAELGRRPLETPRAFAPTFLLEHHSGCVTVITPVSHADPSCAYRIVLSMEGARVEASLPAGSVDWIAYRGSGRVEKKCLQQALPSMAPHDLYGGAMQNLVERFISACTREGPVHAGLEEEAQVSEVWAALRASARNNSEVRLNLSNRYGGSP